MGLGEWVRLAEENTRAILYLFGVIIAGCSVVAVCAAWWMDRRAEAHTEPLRKILVWKLKRDGDWPDYLRDEQKEDSVKRAIEPKISAAGYPLFSPTRSD